MKVIFIKDLRGQGKRGEIKELKDGYAKNFLIPKKMAAEATKSMLNEIEQKLAKEQRILREERQAAENMAKELKGVTVTINAKFGGEKMYGSVTTQDVADALKVMGYEIDKKKIKLAPGEMKSVTLTAQMIEDISSGEISFSLEDVGGKVK